ncbi:MAG: metal-sensing transcriptional repressor [Lachnospiraceae bacterium]|nr:metal-sensing transcriptional repressor [Lachnospiraceae bacterium]MCI9545705.1 metal-sensing transcriptional repressor [Lachnospiraceae bacterium]
MQADKGQVTRLIKTARGQLDGVLKMIEEDQYCMDIANQLMASSAVIKKALKEVLRAHMEGCVAQSFEEGSEKAKQEKIDELIQVIERMTK